MVLSTAKASSEESFDFSVTKDTSFVIWRDKALLKPRSMIIIQCRLFLDRAKSPMRGVLIYYVKEYDTRWKLPRQYFPGVVQQTRCIENGKRNSRQWRTWIHDSPVLFFLFENNWCSNQIFNLLNNRKLPLCQRVKTLLLKTIRVFRVWFIFEQHGLMQSKEAIDLWGDGRNWMMIQ